MTFRLRFIFSLVFVLATATFSFGQVDNLVGQISNSSAETFAGSMSGDGRFVVFESRGDIATENPRNSDNNVEIFLFDYAQRRIFQITDTKPVYFDTSVGNVFNNIRVEITNTRPMISNDGRWIVFSSNATIAYPGDGTNPPVVSSTNPGSFDGNAFTSPTPTPSPSPSPSPSPGANPLTRDANLEVWMYQIPAYAPVANLSLGDEIPFVELAGGTFIRATNTIPSQLPLPATSTSGAYIADDNHDASISDDGSVIAFGSTRDLVPAVGNAFPAEDNEEIFTFVRTSGTLNQVTKTGRGPISNPIYNKSPSISGNGLRVSFVSTGENPVVGMTGGSNPLSSRNEEVHFSDLTAAGTPGAIKRQVTTTTPTNPGDIINIYSLGRRMSRDGRYIAFDSYADLANENSGANQTSFALYVYDVTASTFRRICARSNADDAALGGDVDRYPGFTDTDVNGTPSTLVLQTRMNIKPDGTVPTTASEGLNPDEIRPTQIYSYQLSAPPATAIFTRLSKFPAPTSFLASTQPLPSNSRTRMAFNFALTELGTGNFDLSSETFYMVTPTNTNSSPVSINFATGATRMPVSQTAITPTPTPSPTATPTPTPTPSPTPTPTGSPTPTPTPSPTPPPNTPPAVFGLAPGMLASLSYQTGFDETLVVRSATGSIKRRFELPIELSGVSMTINGAACGLSYVSRHRIDFVVPPGLGSAAAGTEYPLAIISNGTVYKTKVMIVPARPDVLRVDGIVAQGGRARVLNVTNRVHTPEPFTVTTRRIRPFGRTQSRLRVYLTGVSAATVSNTQVRIGTRSLTGVTVASDAVLFDTGIYYIDFLLPPDIANSGDSAVVVTVIIDGVPFSSRFDDTASQIFILP